MNIDYALHYVRQGWAIFPVRPDRKDPITAHGFHDASTNEAQVLAWWEKTPAANIGVASGEASGVVVLDIDRKHGVDGMLAFAELEPQLPPTMVVKTPSGGYHLIYSWPRERACFGRFPGVRPGLDLLGNDGYFVAAGSRVDGKLYEIVRQHPIAACPQALIDLAATPKKAANGGAGELHQVKKAPATQRNNYLTRIGGAFRRIGFDEGELITALLVVNTLRCDPPLHESEVRRVAASVRRYTANPQASREVDAGPVILSCRPLAELLAAEYPPPQYLAEPLLPDPSLSLVYGPSGIAKTYFCLGLALSIASGAKFLGWPIERRHGVLYVDGEMGNAPLQSRIRRLLAGHELDPENFFSITRDDQANGIIPNLEDTAAQQSLLDTLPDACGLVVLDNLSTLTAMLEANDPASWATMQDLLLQFRRRGISVMVVHHANAGGLNQLGTSRRLHVMDTVLSLRPHERTEGPVPGYHDVEVHVVKGRNLPPEVRSPLIATLGGAAGSDLVWTHQSMGSGASERIRSLLKLGMPIKDVIDEVGCNRSLAYRIKAEMKHDAGSAKTYRDRDDY
jgi:putative DNA primase/helicase